MISKGAPIQVAPFFVFRELFASLRPILIPLGGRGYHIPTATQLCYSQFPGDNPVDRPLTADIWTS